MRELNSEVLGQFARRGLKINEGIAVDARLVKSASRPLSNDELRKERQKREIGEADTDRNGNPIKFRRDLDSDWTIKNDKPHFGLKEHVSVDVNNGFLLATKLTPASEHDSKYLPYLALASCHTEDPIEAIYGDKGYYGEPNRSFLNLNDIEDRIMRKDTTTAKITEYEKERNKAISKKRYIVEQYFGITHLNDKGYVARFTSIVKNTLDCMFRQMAFNMSRAVKVLGVT